MDAKRKALPQTAYQQSNGKIERFHQSLKRESIRQRVPLSLEDARRVIGVFIRESNENRLHIVIGWVTPAAKMAGEEVQIWLGRERRISEAREKRAKMRQQQRMGENPKIELTETLYLSISR